MKTLEWGEETTESLIIMGRNSSLLSKKLKFGLIGCSRVAKKEVIPSIINSKIAQLEMIGSRYEEKALEFCNEFGCNSYGTYEDVLRNKNIDVVYISLPIALHEQWVIKSAKFKKHVLCEKSSTTTLRSAKKMVEVCKENNVRLLENFMFRYHPQHKIVAELIKQGALGELLNFRGYFGFPYPEEGNIRLKKDLGGGVLNDAACYPIYASRMIFNEEPISLSCRLKKDLEYMVDSKADAFLVYPGDKVAFISAAFGAYFQSAYNLWGSKSFLSMRRAYAVPRDMETKIFLEQNDLVTEKIIPPADQFGLIIEDFCKEILQKKNSTKNFESDLVSQAKVLAAARLSNNEGGRMVDLSEFS